MSRQLKKLTYGPLHLYCKESDCQLGQWFLSLFGLRCKMDYPINVYLIYGDGEIEAKEGIHVRIPASTPQNRTNHDIAYQSVANSEKWIFCQSSELHLRFDLIAFSAWTLGRGEEIAQIGEKTAWNQHNQFGVESTRAFALGIWQRPYLDVLLKELLSYIEAQSTSHPRSPLIQDSLWKGRRYAVWLTHDVDSLTGRYCITLRLILWFINILKQYCQLKFSAAREELKNILWWFNSTYDPHFSFTSLTRFESALGMKSTFFFLSLKRGLSKAEGRRYAVNHPLALEAFHILKDSNNGIGLHAAYERPFDSAYAKEQRERLSFASSTDVMMVRNHYLRVCYPESWRAHWQAGFKVASNMGWSSENGFRAGTCWPYKPWDLETNQEIPLWEIPLIYMDTSAESLSSIEDDIMKLFSEVRKVHGLFTANFHSQYWQGKEEREQGRTRAYINWLVELQKNSDVSVLNHQDIMTLLLK